jgi:hypothetical protein
VRYYTTVTTTAILFGERRSMGHPSVTLEKITLICPITQKRLRDPGPIIPYPPYFCLHHSACQMMSSLRKSVRGELCPKHRPFDRSAFAEYKAQYNRSLVASKVESKATPCPVCKKMVNWLIFCEETAKLLLQHTGLAATVTEVGTPIRS